MILNYINKYEIKHALTTTVKSTSFYIIWIPVADDVTHYAHADPDDVCLGSTAIEYDTNTNINQATG